MQMGKLLSCKDNRIDISEIPFKKYLDRQITITLIRNDELQTKKYGAVCIPYDRYIYSIVNVTRMALTHYMELQEENKIKKLIEDNKFIEIKCDCDYSKKHGQHFGASFEDDLGDDLEEREETIESLQQPTLVCRGCCQDWGKMPKEVIDIYSGKSEFDGIRRDAELIVPDENGLIWAIFDDKHIDWERTGHIYIR